MHEEQRPLLESALLRGGPGFCGRCETGRASRVLREQNLVLERDAGSLRARRGGGGAGRRKPGQPAPRQPAMPGTRRPGWGLRPAPLTLTSPQPTIEHPL